MFEHLKAELPRLLPLSVEWARQMESAIQRSGRELSEDELEIARAMDVRRPEAIRIAEVGKIPYPQHAYLAMLASQTGVLTDATGALTLGYGIFLRADQAANKQLLAHELRHVAQYECFGSVEEFLRIYLLEITHFGYGPGPLEVDADVASQRYAAAPLGAV